jgi:hypothetical protein
MEIVNTVASMNEPTSAEQTLTQLPFDEKDMKLAKALARHLGYGESYAYTSSSALVGMHCLARYPGQKVGCIVKTKELGIVFVSTLEDLGLERLLNE